MTVAAMPAKPRIIGVTYTALAGEIDLKIGTWAS
jgi:hypothetical protein